MKIKLSVCILILFLGFKSLNAQNMDSTKKENNTEIYDAAKWGLKYHFFSPGKGFVGLSAEIAVNNNINFEIGTNLIGLGIIRPNNYYAFDRYENYTEKGVGFRFGAKFRIKSTNVFTGNRKAFQGPYFSLEMLLNSYKYSFNQYDQNLNVIPQSGNVALFATLGQMGYQHVFHERLLLDFSLGYGYAIPSVRDATPLIGNDPNQGPNPVVTTGERPGEHRFQHGLNLFSGSNLAFTSQFKIGYIF